MLSSEVLSFYVYFCPSSGSFVYGVRKVSRVIVLSHDHPLSLAALL